ncbi:MAG: CHAP domain-containing protein [Bryobacterales bacterium]|nr:CHAP domain-containing protein [Bryobacterales bacterium]
MPAAETLPFPGRTLKAGSHDTAAVLAVQRRLNAVGCGPVLEDGIFGAETMDAVELFQARSVDRFGVPLKVDGEVGPMTWGALFGGRSVPAVSVAPAPLLREALKTAAAEIGTMEDPPGSNRGPKIDQYLKAVGLNPASGSYPWCAAFVYWCFRQAAASLGASNPLVRTAGVLDHWNRAGERGIRRILCAEAREEPAVVLPGMIFIITTGSGNGHTGLVERVEGVRLTTIEGNTNNEGSREGVGVFRRKARRMDQINRGFISYG